MHCIVLSAGVEGDPECLSDDYRQPAAPPHQLEKQPADGGKAGVGAARLFITRRNRARPPSPPCPPAMPVSCVLRPRTPTPRVPAAAGALIKAQSDGFAAARLNRAWVRARRSRPAGFAEIFVGGAHGLDLLEGIY